MARLSAERIGARIKERREELKAQDEKWTQPYVANEVQQRTGAKTQGADISRYETGRHLPGHDTLEAIADVLGVTVSTLYSDPPDKSSTPDIGDALGDKSDVQVLTELVLEMRSEMRTLANEVHRLSGQEPGEQSGS